MTYEIELLGFDPKEDAVDCSTTAKVFIETELTDPTAIVRETVRRYPFKKCGVYWNSKMSKVIRKVNIL